MSGLRTYTVYTRTRGVHICAAYNKRHAIAATVSLFARDADWNPKEVCSWAVSERGRDNLSTDPEVRSSAEIGSLEAAPPHERSAAAADGEKETGERCDS